MTRRGLLAGLLAAAVVAVVRPGRPVANAAPRGVGGSGTARQWAWVALPDSGGLQVFVTAQQSGALPVSWTAEGVVTCGMLSVTAPPIGSAITTQHVSSGAGFGLAVRRATT